MHLLLYTETVVAGKRATVLGHTIHWDY